MQFSFQTTRIDVNIPTPAALETEISRRLTAREGFALATINLDHLVKLRASPDFTRAYAAQDLVIADGWPIVALSRLAGRPVDLMPGSDMVVPLCRWAARSGARVALVGSTDETLEVARAALIARVPGLDIAYTHAPPMGFDPGGAAADAVLSDLSANDIALCLVALGAPKQELFAAYGRDVSPAIGFASIGAGLDFLSGRQVRAPRLMRRLGLEWLWRALSSPRRLIPRYTRCLAILPGEVLRALRLRG